VIGNSNKDWRGYVTLAEPVDYEVQPFYQIPIAAFVSTFEIIRNWVHYMVFNVTFKNISHNVVSSTPHHEQD
jgi:hypothetical protein